MTQAADVLIKYRDVIGYGKLLKRVVLSQLDLMTSGMQVPSEGEGGVYLHVLQAGVGVGVGVGLVGCDACMQIVTHL